MSNALKNYSLAFSLLLFAWFFAVGCTDAKSNKPFVVGAVKKEFTDAVCTLEYQKKYIFIDYYPEPENEFWVNLDGKDVQLTSAKEIGQGIVQFKAGDLTVTVDYGPGEEWPPPGKIGMDATIYKKAKITFAKGTQFYRLKAEGACY